MKKKIIVFVETGEVRPPKANEWYLYGRHPQQAMSGHDNVAQEIIARHEIEIDGDKPATATIRYTPGVRVWRECPGEMPFINDKYANRLGEIAIRKREDNDEYRGTTRVIESREPTKVEVTVNAK